jgi:hypothetical protein
LRKMCRWLFLHSLENPLHSLSTLSQCNFLPARTYVGIFSLYLSLSHSQTCMCGGSLGVVVHFACCDKVMVKMGWWWLALGTCSLCSGFPSV